MDDPSITPEVRRSLEELARHFELIARGYQALNGRENGRARYERVRLIAQTIRAHLANSTNPIGGVA
ncbi:MAG TPA: hypothetical protein VFG07_10640 [Thermoplasmata archaeon]|nr:hypothetical protein [Thermoplasmata archaeon]